MTRIGRGRDRLETGAVAVEFALVLPILVALLLGITTAGISYSHAVGLANATREGARFGATADACGTAPTSPACSTSLPGGSTWASNVIDRLRVTQSDDGITAATSSTTVCVQLFRKTGVAAGVATGSPLVDWTCSNGTQNAPTVTTPATAGGAPRVPTETANGGCVVRVIAARKFNINTVHKNWTSVNSARSVARYERTDRVGQCI